MSVENFLRKFSFNRFLTLNFSLISGYMSSKSRYYIYDEKRVIQSNLNSMRWFCSSNILSFVTTVADVNVLSAISLPDSSKYAD